MLADQSQKMIDEAISHAIGKPFVTEKKMSVGGGSISASFVITSKNGSFFLKTNDPQFAHMFEAESDGLLALAKADAIRVPNSICYGETKSQAFLVLENITMKNAGKAAAENFGRQLAKLHQIKSDQFGWFRDNTIGSTLQVNSLSPNWLSFYREHRLEFQLSLAKQQGFDGELQQLGNALCEKLPAFFESYQPYPALLHGDLWSGNYAYSMEAEPVIFDPAVYYGDREADIAMTELFGGFPVSFYQAYNEVLPLDKGYQERKYLYNLYHILNHLNLFGSGYYSQSIETIKRLL